MAAGIPADAPDPYAPPPGTFRVRLEHLVVKPNVPCGMDYGALGGPALKMARTTTEDDVPARVRRRPGLPAPYYELTDGRHRFLRALIAGRTDLLCTEER